MAIGSFHSAIMSACEDLDHGMVVDQLVEDCVHVQIAIARTSLPSSPS